MNMAPDEQIPTQEYVLKTGSHTWIDGKTYAVGDRMQLTKDQMERIGKERFEPVSVSTSAKKESTGTGIASSILTEKPPAPVSSKTKS